MSARTSWMMRCGRGGMTHQKITYQQGGIHFWSYFAEQLPIAWRHMSQ